MQPTSCPSCKHINPPGSNFCNVCGTALPSLQCPHCGSLNDVAVAVDCQQCGGSLLTPGRAPEWTAPAALTPPMPSRPRDDTIAQLFSNPSAIDALPDRASVALQTYELPAMPINLNTDEARTRPVRPMRRGGARIAIGAAAVAAVAAGALYLLQARRDDGPAPAAPIRPAATALPDAAAAALARAQALLNDAPTAAGPVASAAAPALIEPAPAPLPPAPQVAAAPPPTPTPTPTPTPPPPAPARPGRIDASPVVDAAISRRHVAPTVPPTPAQPPPCTDAIAALGLCSR